MKCRGFSLAEILITLVILGFVGALGVPMIGQQKLKKPMTPETQHGTVECYYGDDGRVHMYTSNNTDNKKGRDRVVEGDSCEFTAPTANAYVIQAIGAGGDSGVGLKPTHHIISIPEGGNISTGSPFSTDLAKAPDWVREKWPGIGVTYSLSSPTGSNGRTYCEQFTQTEGHCKKDCAFMDPKDGCTSDCQYQVCANGGQAGHGGNYTVNTTLYTDSVVSCVGSSSSASLSVNGGSITLTPSGSGSDGYFKGESIKNTRYPVNGGNGSPFGVSINGLSATPAGTFSGSGSAGSCGSSPSSVPYRGATPGIQATYSLSADAGTFTSKIFEKLPASNFKLTPAGKIAGTPDASLVEMDDGTGMVKVMEAKSGDNITSLSSGEFSMHAEDLPFPKVLYPYEFNSRIPEISIAPKGYRSELVQRMKKGKHPGASGRGAYPVVTNISGSFPIYIGDLSHPVGSITFKPLKGKNVKCLENKANPVDGACQGLTGNPGAVIVSW